MVASRLVGGFSWNRGAMRDSKSGNLPVIMQRATRNPDTKELSAALRAKFHEIWFAPPELSVGNPHKDRI